MKKFAKRMAVMGLTAMLSVASFSMALGAKYKCIYCDSTNTEFLTDNIQISDEYEPCSHKPAGSLDHVFYRVHNEVYVCHGCGRHPAKPPYYEEMSRICDRTRQADEYSFSALQ